MRKILLEYYLSNKKNFIILLIIFFIGFTIGIVSINSLQIHQKDEIYDEITNLRAIIKESESINYNELLFLSIKKHIITILIIWFLGCTIIGGFFIYITIAYEGFKLGYTISAFIAVLGIRDGLAISIISLLLQNIIYILALFLIAQRGIKLYSGIMKRCINIRKELLAHTIIMLISVLLSCFSSVIEVYISTNLLMFFKEII